MLGCKIVTPLWCTFRVTEEKTIDNRFFEDVTEIRSASREATPRGEGDYISGRKNPGPGSSVKAIRKRKILITFVTRIWCTFRDSNPGPTD